MTLLLRSLVSNMVYFAQAEMTYPEKDYEPALIYKLDSLDERNILLLYSNDVHRAIQAHLANNYESFLCQRLPQDQFCLHAALCI